MIKVFVVTEEGRGGGPLKRMHLMAKALKGKVESVIVLPQSGSLFIKLLDQDEIPYRKLNLHPLTKSFKGAFKYVLFFIPEIFQLWRLFRKEQPDLIHINGSWQIKGLLAGKMAQRPVIWHMNDTYQPMLIRLLFRMFYRLPEGYIFASNRTKKYYEVIVKMPLDHKASAMIPAPVETGKIPFIKRKGMNQKRLLTVGFINPHKGIEVLLEASHLIKSAPIKIDIAGPVLPSQKKYKNKLDQLISKFEISNVSFLGYQNINAAFLEKYDFYLCTSLREASPMAVWEAMASGLPVISTPVGDLPLLLEKFNFGMCSESYTGADLSKAIEQLISINAIDYTKMSQTARRVALEIFSVDKVANHYIRYYSNILSEPAD